MGIFQDLIGQKFGKLTVIKRHEKNIGRQVAWLCKCDCGNDKIISGNSLKQGNGTHCGCILNLTEDQKTERTLIRLKKYMMINNETGCWEWTGYIMPCGYGLTSHKGNKILSHRASWILSNNEIPKGLYVLHRCDNRKCINPDHLFLGTAKDNTHDMRRKGRNRYLAFQGSKHSMAKLNEKLVNQIRLKKSQGMTNQDIARLYGVHKNTIQKITSRTHWKHIPDPEGCAYKKLPRGFNEKSCKLTEEDVIFIKNSHTEKKLSQKEIAAKFRVNRKTIKNIISGKTWKHLHDQK